MMKKALAAMALAGFAMSAQAHVAFTQGFDDVSTLAAQGWTINNASTPGGLTSWYQGDKNIFTSQSGTANSYIAANYNSAPADGTLNNYLITPDFSAADTVTVSFWLRADPVAGFSDKVAFGFSSGGTALTNFVLSAPVTVGTDGWTQYTATMNGLGDGSRARFAIAYVGDANSANYVGLDSLSVDVPEPASLALVAAGLLGLGAFRRKQR